MADYEVSVRYTNYRGETRVRSIRPVRLWFGATKWHPQRQWLLDCIDAEKGEDRTFALAECDFTATEEAA